MSTTAYYDFQALSSLRSQAVQAPGAALREVAGQFESLFMQMMIKSMRDATIKSDLLNSHQMDTYQQMHDQQISLHLSGQGTLGLADILVQQLEQGPRNAEAEQSLAGMPAEAASTRPAFQSRHSEVIPPSPHDSRSAVSYQPVGDQVSSEVRTWAPSSATAFVSDVWEHAVQAAQRLGLNPEVLVAQSALETGWGQRVIPAADGGSSFNLFGIKANHQWEGQAVTVGTLEYRDGIAAREQARFRVYDSIAESFNDYIDMLTRSPRYKKALESASDTSQFLADLQEAGYATDPLYARKIMDVLASPSLSSALSALK